MGNNHPNGVDPDGGDFRAGVVGAVGGAVVGAAAAMVYDGIEYGKIKGKDVLAGAIIGAAAVGFYVGANYDLAFAKYGHRARTIGGWYLDPHSPTMVLKLETIGKATSLAAQGAETPEGFIFNAIGGGSMHIFWNHYSNIFPWQNSFSEGVSNDITTSTFNGNTLSSGQNKMTDPIKYLPGKGRIDLKGTGIPGTSSGTVRVQSATPQARWKFKVKQTRLLKVPKWKIWK